MHKFLIIITIFFVVFAILRFLIWLVEKAPLIEDFDDDEDRLILTNISNTPIEIIDQIEEDF